MKAKRPDHLDDPACGVFGPFHPDDLDTLMSSHLRKHYDPAVVAAHLRLGHEIGPQTRAALADLLEGKLNRPTGRQPREPVEDFKDAHVKAPLALMLIDGIGLARRQGRPLDELPFGGPERGEGTREYVARLLGMSETSLDSLLARTKGIGWTRLKA